MPGQWVDDNVMNAAMRYLNTRYSRGLGLDVHLFDLYKRDNFHHSKWAQVTDSFTQYYKNRRAIFVPLCHNQNHWTLVVFHLVDRCIIHYDPQCPSSATRGIEKISIMRKFIFDDINHHCAGEPLPLALRDFLVWEIEPRPRWPQQTDGYNCGMYCIFAAFALAKGVPICADQTTCDATRAKLFAQFANDTGLEIPPESIRTHLATKERAKIKADAEAAQLLAPMQSTKTFFDLSAVDDAEITKAMSDIDEEDFDVADAEMFDEREAKENDLATKHHLKAHPKDGKAKIIQHLAKTKAAHIDKATRNKLTQPRKYRHNVHTRSYIQFMKRDKKFARQWPDLKSILTTKIPVFKHVPPAVRHRFRDEL